MPVVGEPIYEIDTKKLYIGDGTTSGGVPAIAGFELTDCSDVVLSSDTVYEFTQYAATDDFVFVYFASANPFSEGDDINIISSDVDNITGYHVVVTVDTTSNYVTFANPGIPVTSTTVTNGFASKGLETGTILTWDRTTHKFVSGSPVTSVAELTDVTLTTLADNEVLSYDATLGTWTNAPVATSFADLSDVGVAGVLENFDIVMNYDGTWFNAKFGALVNANAANLQDGDVLTYDATDESWSNAPPSGLQGRLEVTVDPITVGSYSAANGTISNVPSTFVFVKVELDQAGWITFYSSSTARTNDASRTISVDPAPGAGVIAEVATNGFARTYLNPGVIGVLEATDGELNFKIENTTNASLTYNIKIEYVALEGS